METLVREGFVDLVDYREEQGTLDRLDSQEPPVRRVRKVTKATKETKETEAHRDYHGVGEDQEEAALVQKVTKATPEPLARLVHRVREV